MTCYRHVKTATVLSAACALFAAVPAQAKVTIAVIPQAMAAAAVTHVGFCRAAIAPAANSKALASVVRLDKRAALLGGRPSALDQIRMQQSGAAQASEQRLAPLQLPGMADKLDCEGLGRANLPTTPAFTTPVYRSANLGPNDFLASKRLSVRHTSFDPDWARVKRSGLSRRTVAKLANVGSGPVTVSTLGRINSWANDTIRYVEDRDLYGKSDYWATASATLKRRAGDCEDIAIAKLQALAALGVPRSAMYLTVARDLARNADHALLVVKLEGRYWLLDNATNRLLDGELSHDYRPIMSFGASDKWLHGYTQG